VTFYDAHLPLVYAYFARRTPDAPTAEDLTAETFERLAVAWPSFVPRGDPETTMRIWVYRVAANVYRNAWRGALRREARHAAWLSEQPTSADPRTAAERRVLLGQALAGLTPSDRDLLGLRFWEELSAPEIAAVLDLNPREVYTRIERCLRVLKRELSPEREVNHAGL
jgi:RNA polymerase sigma-70 factor (ECF subfamily)